MSIRADAPRDRRTHADSAFATLRAGGDAAHALQDALANDPAPALRQLAIMDARGDAAVHTGAACVPVSSHAVGNGVIAFGAMLTRDHVPDAMLDEFARTRGSLEVRVIAALRVAESLGGDVRGIRAAVLRVYGAQRSVGGVRLDLRVDSDRTPIDTLGALVHQQSIIMSAEAAFNLAAAGDIDAALAAFDRVERDAPDDPDAAARHGIALALAGKTAEARRRLEAAYRDSAGWREAIRRLSAVGLLPADDALTRTLTSS